MGYYDIDDKELGLYFIMAGTQDGSKYTAGVNSGLNVGLNVLLASGSALVFSRRVMSSEHDTTSRLAWDHGARGTTTSSISSTF